MSSNFTFFNVKFTFLSSRKFFLKKKKKKEKATQADISGHISATLSQIRSVYFNEADIRNFD